MAALGNPNPNPNPSPSPNPNPNLNPNPDPYPNPDPDPDQVQRLQKEQKTVQTYLEKLEAKVSAKDYASRAPAATQEEDRGKIADTKVGLDNIRQAIKQFEDGQDLD